MEWRCVMKYRILSVLIMVSVVLGTAGCSPKERKAEQITLDHVYESELIPIDESFIPTITMQMKDGKLFMAGYYGNRESDVYVMSVDTDTDSCDYSFLSIVYTPIAFCVAENGYAILQNHYDVAFHRPVYTLSVCSDKGEILFESDLSAYLPSAEDSAVLWERDGKIYVISGEACVIVDWKGPETDIPKYISLPDAPLSATVNEANELCIFLESKTGERNVYRMDDTDHLVEYETSINWRNVYADTVFKNEADLYYAFTAEGVVRCS